MEILFDQNNGPCKKLERVSSQVKVYRKDVTIIVIYKRTFYLGIEMGMKNFNFNEINYKENCNLQGYI
jgi:hypothetical protein